MLTLVLVSLLCYSRFIVPAVSVEDNIEPDLTDHNSPVLTEDDANSDQDLIEDNIEPDLTDHNSPVLTEDAANSGQDLMEELLALVNTVAAQTSEISSLQDVKQRQRSQIASVTRQLDDMKRQRSAYTPGKRQQVVTSRQAVSVAPSNVTNQHIAFHATFNSATSQQVLAGHVVAFNNVHLNIGHGFVAVRNVFVAPVSGVYLFSVSMEATTSGLAKGALTKNGERVAVAYSDALDYDFHTAAMYDQGAASATMALLKGDEVWVQAFLESKHDISGAGNTMFSGVLIWQTE